MSDASKRAPEGDPADKCERDAAPPSDYLETVLGALEAMLRPDDAERTDDEMPADDSDAPPNRHDEDS